MADDRITLNGLVVRLDNGPTILMEVGDSNKRHHLAAEPSISLENWLGRFVTVRGYFDVPRYMTFVVEDIKPSGAQ